MICTLNKIKIFFTICITALSICSYAQPEPFRVTLDAGHGGEDKGASNGKYIEKEIALSIVLKTGAILESHKYVHVDYTRKTDVLIDLVQRGLIANYNNASVFVSIHCNANIKSQPYGTETYVMGLDKKDVNLAVVKKENEAFISRTDKGQALDKFKTELSSINGFEAKILQEAHMGGSVAIAGYVEKEFEKAGRLVRGEKGVKPAPFMVLHKAIMPRVLIEVGFISNPTEGAYLYSEAGQNEIARAVANSILSFKTEFFGTDAQIEAENVRRSLPKDFSIPAPSKDVLASTKIQTQPKKKADSLVIEKPVLLTTIPTEASKTVVVESTAIPKPIPVSVNNTVTSDAFSNLSCKVQFFASANKHELNSPKFNGFQAVSEEIDGTLFKYSCGLTTNLNESISTLKAIQSNGFPSAFLVVFKSGKRLNDSELKTLMVENDIYNTLVAQKNSASKNPVVVEKDEIIEALIAENSNKSIDFLKTDYKVQLMATKTYVDNFEFNSRGLKDIEVSFENGFYKYLYGSTSDYNTSLVYIEEAKSKGYPGAFLIAFKGGRKLSLDELKTLTIQEANK